ncbi:MAG: cytidine deaminase [Gemmatimonadales bacterium]
MDDAELISAATALVGGFSPSLDCSAGGVAAALITADGNVYTGICVDTACSMGFCAEHAAVAEMLKARESHIQTIVAVTNPEGVIPPCGRCRELLWQIDSRNCETRVIVAPGKVVALSDLLPQPRWREC